MVSGQVPFTVMRDAFNRKEGTSRPLAVLRLYSFRLAVVVTVLALLLVTSEVVLRVCDVSFPVFDTYDADRGNALLPNKQGLYDREGRANISINSLGYRDMEHATAKGANTHRIAFLGDSFTEARQVPFHDTFHQILGRTLQGDPDYLDREVEVLNFGIAGYGTAQEWITLQRDVLAHSPDQVALVFFAGNDLADNYRAVPCHFQKTFRPYPVVSGEEIALDMSFRNPSFNYYWMRLRFLAPQYFRTAEVLNQVRRRGHQQRFVRALSIRDANMLLINPLEVRPDLGVLSANSPAVWQSAWKTTEALIGRIAQDCLDHGSDFILIVGSMPIQVHPDSIQRDRYIQYTHGKDVFYPETRLRRLGAARRFPVITVAEVMQRKAEEEGVYYHGFSNTVIGEGHWNTAGHRLVADVLARHWPR